MAALQISSAFDPKFGMMVPSSTILRRASSIYDHYFWLRISDEFLLHKTSSFVVHTKQYEQETYKIHNNFRLHKSNEKLTLVEALSITLALIPSNLASYSLAPPRIDNTSDGGALTVFLDLVKADDVPMHEMAAIATRQAFILACI